VKVSSAGWLVLVLVAPRYTTAQAGEQALVLRGRVIDARTAAPLRDVNIVVTSGGDTLARIRSDSTGVFQSPVGSATSVVAHFARIGYRADSLTSSAGLEFPLRVAMAPIGAAANTLAAVIVRDTARSSFDQRARRNSGGSFIREEDIKKKKPLRTSDLFRNYPGVRVDDSSGVTRLVSLRSARQMSPSGPSLLVGRDSVRSPNNARYCVLRVGIDGRLMPNEYSVDDVRPGEIAAIELYLGAATLPVEFSSVQQDAPCGIIMIWIKGVKR
jgi:hypothetical protein